MNHKTNTAEQTFGFDGTAGGLIEVLSRYPANTRVAFEDSDYGALQIDLVQEAKTSPVAGSAGGLLEDDQNGELTLFIC